MNKIKLFLALGAVFLLGLNGQVVHAQKLPDKPVKILVPFAPGGGAALLARTMSTSLTEHWGQPVVVENRPGASGNIGAEAVARAEPDGYTMLLTSSAFVISPGMSSKLPFNVEKDFTPITLAVELPNVLVVHPSVQANSVAELVALIKGNKTKINYASPGNGTGGHLAAELFKQSAGVDILHVPYKGASESTTAVIGKQVDFALAISSVALPHIASGRLVPLAVTGLQRNAHVLDARIAKVHGVGMTLAAVADDQDLLALDQVHVGITIVVDTHRGQSSWQLLLAKNGG